MSTQGSAADTTYQPPEAYSDPASEHLAATQDAAIHDSSYVGRLKATGADALDLLNRLSTNQVLNLEPGQGAPTIMTTDRGRILDLISVVNFGNYALLLTSPGEQQRVIDWLDKYTIMEDLEVEDLTRELAMFTVLGPKSLERLNRLGEQAISELPPYHTKTVNVAGHEVEVISRPLANLPAFELIASREASGAIWNALVDSGIAPLGLKSYQALRVELGIPTYGREMGESYNPLEAGLIGSVDFHKGCYIGQEVIARLDTYRKVQKHLVSLCFSEGASASEGDTLELDGQAVGEVTSVTVIPTSGKTVGLGYVRSAAAQVGNRLTLASVNGAQVEITDLPMLFGPGEE